MIYNSNKYGVLNIPLLKDFIRPLFHILFAVYDGNGNVSALVNASNGEVSANYEYGPYGEPIRVSGIMSRENPFRFSTKRIVDSINIILYEYRAYSPSLGWWLSRNPIGEDGGINLYSLVGNSTVNSIDFFGFWKITRDRSKYWAVAEINNESDTPKSLALLLRLDESEFHKWAREIDCRKYEIPNTIVVYTSRPGLFDGYFSFVTQLRRLAVQFGENADSKNYRVLFCLNDSSDTDFRDLWETDGIYGIAFAGHGTRYGFKADPSSDNAVAPNDVSPPYKLAYIMAFSCYSANPFLSSIDAQGNNILINWQIYLSGAGRFIGFNGLVNWINGIYNIEIY
ncbi:MAG TPA: RHS repeat-associated core domain-containing protein [Verrucomicrobiota bacterium]|nr:RHS repeat-associated core domain-containing protein [Verrucomicrobiota bacterium]